MFFLEYDFLRSFERLKFYLMFLFPKGFVKDFKSMDQWRDLFFLVRRIKFGFLKDLNFNLAVFPKGLHLDFVKGFKSMDQWRD